MNPCELCETLGGAVLWQNTACRVVRVADPHYPGFCRVVWNAHVREMSDLDAPSRQYLMAVVFAVEAAVRQTCRPDKVNLASFGNVTPHLHWHVIPRWREDRHFPEPVWGQVRRENATPRLEIADSVLQEALLVALGDLEAPPRS